MNNRIKLLAEQAGYSKDFLVIGLPNNMEKFTQLIIEECIAITDSLVHRNTDGTWTSNELYTDYNGALFLAKRKIQETFEVKE